MTSYHLMYSENGLVFSYIIDRNGDPFVFQGPIDKVKQVQQIFNEPIEASFVRIVPQTWHKGIAVRAQLLGCNHDKEPTMATTTDTIFIGTEVPPGIFISSTIFPL